MERFPNINKITGSVEEDKVESKLEYNRANSLENYKDLEVEPTEEEIRVIDDTIFGLNIMFEKVYGLKPKPITKDRIHILRVGSLTGKYGRGMHQSPSGDIFLEPLEGCQSKIIFMKVFAHELIHYLSFQSVKVYESNGSVKVRPHLSGLSIIDYEKDGVGDYFGVVDEALTSYISYRFFQMELESARKHPEEKRSYTDESLAVDLINDWLEALPDSFGVDKTEWAKPNTISIPFAEDIAKVIKSDIPIEKKVEYYQNKMGSLSKEKKEEYFLERMWEIEKVYKKISEMFASEDSDPVSVKGKTMEFVDKIVLLKLTGRGFYDIVRFIEKRLGRDSFKKLAGAFSKFSAKD